MADNHLCIICNGKEISYGLNLYHLFLYKDQKESFKSNTYKGIKVDIYSIAAFKHANVSKKDKKIYIGDVNTPPAITSKDIIFEKYGMIIFQSNESLYLEVNPKKLSGNAYMEFLAYANQRRQDYIETEKHYAETVAVKDVRWIAETFNPIEKKGLFGINNNDVNKRQQQYDCLAFVTYLDYIEKFIG